MRRASWGEKPYTNTLEWRGVIVCFVSSLKASKRGCKRPAKETLLGPTRLWKRPITLRSKRVKNATERRISKHCKTQDKTIGIGFNQ